MYSFLISLQFIIVVLLAISVLVQKTDTDGLSGLSGGSAQFGGVPKRGKGNFLTKTTMFLGVLFMLNSIIIAKIFVNEVRESKAITEGIDDKITEIQSEQGTGGSSSNQVPKA